MAMSSDSKSMLTIPKLVAHCKKGFVVFTEKVSSNCENDLFETRNHRFVTQDETEYPQFQTTYIIMSCDFSTLEHQTSAQ